MADKLKQYIGSKAVRRYMLLDLIAAIGLLCEFIAFEYGVLKILRYLVLIQALFVIAWKDRKEHVISNKYLAVLFGIRTILLICEWIVYPTYGLSIFFSALLGLVIGAGVFGLCYLISRGGMGAGDVKLMGVLGYYLGGSAIMPVMILTVLASGLYSIVNLILKKTSLKTEIPFGPFVLIGTLLGMALGV